MNTLFLAQADDFFQFDDLPIEQAQEWAEELEQWAGDYWPDWQLADEIGCEFD